MLRNQSFIHFKDYKTAIRCTGAVQKNDIFLAFDRYEGSKRLKVYINQTPTSAKSRKDMLKGGKNTIR